MEARRTAPLHRADDLPARSRAVAGALAVVIVAAGPGCAVLDRRPRVSEAAARGLLVEAVGMVQEGRVGDLCGLAAADASTCAESVESVGELVPEDPPVVVCAHPLPATGPMRHGTLLVLEGDDGAAEPYRSEFPVYHDGRAVVALDPVYWGGLRVVGYGEQTMTWRFDSASEVCETRALPRLEGEPPVPLRSPAGG